MIDQLKNKIVVYSQRTFFSIIQKYSMFLISLLVYVLLIADIFIIIILGFKKEQLFK